MSYRVMCLVGILSVSVNRNKCGITLAWVWDRKCNYLQFTINQDAASHTSCTLCAFCWSMFLFFSAEGDCPGENAGQWKAAGLSWLLFRIPEQAESQQRQPLSRHGFRRPQRWLPHQCGEERGGLLQGGWAVLLQFLQQTWGRSCGLPERLAVRQLLVLHQSRL